MLTIEELIVSQDRPLVTIGMPVYNGENYLVEAIHSVLGQTYTNFELVISDNASTDQTETICRTLAAQDQRIRYDRAPENKGASWNYNRVVALAAGKYFRWLAHDDALEPTTLEKSVKVLEDRPEVVLCFTWTQDIDGEGNPIVIKSSKVNSDARAADKRFFGLSRVYPAHKCEEVFGLIRTDVLRSTKMIDNYTDSDRTLLAALGLVGPFYEIPEPLFLHRIHKDSSVEANPEPHGRMAWFDPKLRGRLVFPRWRQMYELFLVIARSPQPLSVKLICYRHMLNWIKRGRTKLGNELIWATRQLFSLSRA
jgi:glycosyltransferase involved in cell wall biosynthesis